MRKPARSSSQGKLLIHLSLLHHYKGPALLAGSQAFKGLCPAGDQTPSNSTQKQRQVEEAVMVIYLFMIGRWSSEGLKRVCKKGYSGQGITVLVVQQQGSLRPSDLSRAAGKAGIGRSSYFQIITILCIIRHY